VSKRCCGNKKRTGGRDLPCIFGTESESKKKKGAPSMLASHRGAADSIPAFPGSKEPENPAKTQRYQDISDAPHKTRTYKTRSGTSWHHDRDNKGTVWRRGGGGRKGSKSGQESSHTEDARRKNLEEIRRRWVLPEDVVNGSLSQQGSLNPPFSRRPASPGDVQRIALFCCSPINNQTK